ncbi:MAG: helix-turn-helix transcriptional regulator [Anaerohalosphaeraceae bacterium]
MKREKSKNGLALLHEKFIKGDKRRLAELEAEREKIKIAEQVYALRQQMGLTQKQLADLIGTTQSVISRLESADYENERLKTLQKLAAALQCKLEVRFVPQSQKVCT